MASPTLKPDKKLSEFLKDKQEPFILELYLFERSNCSKNWSSNSIKNLEKPASSCFFNKKRKPLFPFLKVLLTAIHDTKKKKKKKEEVTTTNDSNITNQHANVAVTVTHQHEANNVDQVPIETDRFSTASSSTLFNSCSDIDDDEEDRTSFSSNKHYNPLFSSDTCQASDVCNMRMQSQQDGKHQQRCIEEVCVTHETLNKNVSVCGVVVPKKFTEESLLSAALFSSLIQTSKRDHNYTKELKEILGHDVSHVMKSKRVLHKTKRLLFDCVRELTKNLPEKDCKQFMGAEKLGKMLWERTKEWSERGRNYERNLSNLLNLDYLDSIDEWSEFKTEVKDVSIEIADAILECVIRDEVVSDIIEILSHNKINFCCCK